MAELAKKPISLGKTCVISSSRQHACVRFSRPMRKFFYVLLRETGIFVISAIHQVDNFCSYAGIAILIPRRNLTPNVRISFREHIPTPPGKAAKSQTC